MISFNRLPKGSYFTWKNRTYRKVASYTALDVETDVLLDFGLSNEVEARDRPTNRISLVIQYMESALLQAYLAENPGAKKVHIDIDIENRSVQAQVD